MPVQINEVIIRAIVAPSAEKNETGTGATDCNSDHEGAGKNAGMAIAETSELVEQIFEIIREKKER